MYIGTYAPWEHYPKTLRQYEIENPLSVIADFFSCDSVKGHRKRLKEWRHFVVSGEVYNDERHGPGSLLFVYNMNLKVLEACFVRYCNYQNFSYQYKEPIEQQLKEEKQKWTFFPDDLSQKEILNPYKAIKKVFKKILPQGYRDHLHEWSEAAFYTTPDPDSLYASEVIDVYENLLKLYSAAWIIHQRECERPILKLEFRDEEKSLLKNKIAIKVFAPSPSTTETVGLNELKELVLSKFPTIEMIVHIGTHHEPFTYFLLILIGSTEKIPEGEFGNKVEDHCKFLGNVHTIVHKTASAKSGLEQSHRFWITSIGKGNMIYQSPDLELPELQTISEETVIERANFHWERWGKQAQEFLSGAELYNKKKNYRIAAFMLHQTAESALKAILQAVLGYRVQMHNLARLLRLSLLITDDLKNVFKLNTLEGAAEFTILQNAYSKSRYSNSFDPDEVSVTSLYITVEQFYKVAEAVYLKFLEEQSKKEN